MSEPEAFEAPAAWNRGADAWREFVRSGADYYRLLVHGPALLSACQPVAGLSTLDLGCGEGYFSRALARAGAAVVGVDIASEQIRFAREDEAENPLGITYEIVDAEHLRGRWDEGSFELVTACMSVQDMADAAEVARQVAGVLRRPGRFVFSVPHPATDTAVREWERDETGRKLTLKIDGYFDTGASVLHWNMARLKYRWSTPYSRRTLEEWSTLLANAGFVIRRLLEPRPSGEAVQRNPELEDCARVPYFLIFDAVVA